MRALALVLLAGADAGTPVVWPKQPSPVYRARAELPKEWERAVPDDFDFGREMLAGEIERPPVRIVEPASVVREGARTLVVPKKRSHCAPCKTVQVNSVEEYAGTTPRHPQPQYEAAEVYRLPQAKGKVYVAAVVEETCPRCPGGN